MTIIFWVISERWWEPQQTVWLKGHYHCSATKRNFIKIWEMENSICSQGFWKKKVNARQAWLVKMCYADEFGVRISGQKREIMTHILHFHGMRPYKCTRVITLLAMLRSPLSGPSWYGSAWDIKHIATTTGASFSYAVVSAQSKGSNVF